MEELTRPAAAAPPPTSATALEVWCGLRRVELAAGGQDAQRDRQVEAARVLGQIGRGQVDRDALVVGNSSPAFWIAERTRFRASFTSTSATPTNVKLGKPLARCTSTVTLAGLQAQQGTALHQR